MRLVVLFATCFALSHWAHAADPHTIGVDDYFTLAAINEIAISSAAKSVAYTEGRWQESTNDRKTDIWIAPITGEGPRRLTFDRAGYDTLRWSLDGKYVFCATRVRQADKFGPPYDGSRQVWRIAADGSGMIPVTRNEGGINAFDLTAGDKSIVFTTSNSTDRGDWSTLRSRFGAIKYGTRKKPTTSFHQTDLNTWRTTSLAKYDGFVDAFSLSFDGQRIAMVTGNDGSVTVMEGQSELTILDLATGKAVDLPDDQWRKDLTSPYGRLAQPQWSADGEALAFAVGFDAYPSEVFIADMKDPAKPVIRKVARPGTVSLHGGVDGGMALAWKGKSRDLCFLGDDHARVRIYCARNATGGGPIESLTDGDEVIDTFVWDRDGSVFAAIKSGPMKLHNVYVTQDGDMTTKQITDINRHVRDWRLPTISIVKWSGAGGQTVEGLLELPPDYKSGTALPTIINLHGGPTAAVGYNTVFGYFGSMLFASRGYAFFSPNYRGSTGYGDKFITDLVGRENDIEVDDILLGIDKLVADGISHKDQLGVGGWSNGGYLTNCLIARSNRFKAASSGAGIIDQVMEWGTNDEPAFPRIFSGGMPWEVPDAYRKASPLYSFGKVRTPTLFHVGENDARCPKGHSEAAYRALKEVLNVESELLVYPREEHGLGSYTSRRIKMTWDLAWFDHFLKGKPKP